MYTRDQPDQTLWISTSDKKATEAGSLYWCNRLTQQTIKKTCCTSGAAAGVAASAGGAAGVAAAAASPPDAAGVAVVVVVVVVVVGAVTFSRPGMEESWKHLEDWKTTDIYLFIFYNRFHSLSPAVQIRAGD